MKEELLQIAKMLIKMTSHNEGEVIHQYINAIKKDKINVARIISDEVMDCFINENAESKKSQLATKLYNKTMEYYELNV